MRYWVIGQPAPGVAHTGLTRDDANRVTRFVQADWQVALEYAGSTALHPSRVEVAGNDAQIRLVIDRLELAPP
jgi:outer membrane biogenesis lipoprotein LolB